MILSELLSVLSLTSLHVINEVEIETVECLDLSLDSRDIFPGSVFVAINGHQLDGRDFISDAVANGASAIIYEMTGVTKEQESQIKDARIACIGVANLSDHMSTLAAHFFAYPSDDLQVYGVTGTNGKTSCAFMLAQAFNYLGHQTAFMGTIGVGHPHQLKTTTHTTLDAISLQRYLAGLLEEKFSHVCIEVSSHALDQGRVAAVNFYAVLHTNLSQDHLDYHHTMEAYAASKKRLFTQFEPTLAVVNVNDELGKELQQCANAEFVVSYGQEADAADVFVESMIATNQGLSIDFASDSLEFTVQSQLVGLVNVPNINLVVTTLLALGIEVEDIQSVLPKIAAAPGRMEVYSQKNKPMVVVDYAHTPTALKLALEACRIHCKGELWLVFGCGGDRDQFKRAMMGEIAEQYADKVVVSNDNPRSEKPAAIIEAIVHKMQVLPIIIEDRPAAVAYVIAQAASNDVVLIAGKGHETEQRIGSQVLPYSDRAWVKQCMEVAV